MNYLNGKSCYLCGPIASVDDGGADWRNLITPKLEQFGLKVYDPLKKDNPDLSESPEDRQRFRDLIMQENWKSHKELFWPVARWDLRAVDKSDFIIFNYDPNIPTVGSIHELVTANLARKPILLKYNKSQLDKFNYWIPVLIKTENFFSTWESMFESLREVDAGNYNTSYWTL